MTFTSLLFAAFVVITIIVYYTLPLGKYQWTVLLAASYFFYVYNSFRYTAFLMLTTFSIYLCARIIDRIAAGASAELKEKKSGWSREEKKIFKKQVEKKKKTILALGLILNFGVLFLLKYLNFLAGGLMHLMGNTQPDIKIVSLLLPLGISFYTFQATGYLIDVYRGTIKSEGNIFRFALFVSFFPQVVQGPISEFEQLGGQLFDRHRPQWVRFKTGGELILWGLFKKLVIADRAVEAIRTVSGDYVSFSGEMILFAAVLYALQLYADFSGGIDIARGVAHILGIDMEMNFRQPYFSKSISEYWRRWHITLGAWMKKYVFYSLAVSDGFMSMSKAIGRTRFGMTAAGKHIARTLPTALASFIVFLLIGIWHGANSRYIGFGLWNGGVIMFSTLMAPAYAAWIKGLHIDAKSKIWQLFQMIRTFVVILVGYYFDIAPDITGAVDMMKRSIFDLNGMITMGDLSAVGLGKSDVLVLFYGLLVLFYFSVRLEMGRLDAPGNLINSRAPWIQWLVILIGIISVIMFGIYGSGYDPADFVYMGF